MSESLFLNQHIREFASSHPHQEGWKVYELPTHKATKGYLHLLLDFLRDLHPDAILRRAAIKELSDEEIAESPGFTHPADAGTEWDVSKELDSVGWFGSLHVRWNNCEIHFMNFLLKNDGGYTNVYHVAAKSNVALRNLLIEVERYGKAKRKDDQRYIHVVNGEDIPIHPVSWNDICLPSHFAESIRKNVAAFFQSHELYCSLGIPHRRGLLFSGPPGCGKTMTIKALVSEAAAQPITVLGTADVEDQHIDMVFRIATKQAPAIVVFEDLDKLVRSKSISLSHFLNILDGFRALNGVMTIASSNEPELLDQALLQRPSRFDRIWTFSLPATEQRLALLRKRGEGYFSEAALQEAADQSRGFSMAYVQEIVVNALLESAHNGTTPSDADLLRSLDTLQSQRKTATRKLDSLGEPESVGFALPNGN